MPDEKAVLDSDLCLHILNVGAGDSILVEFPAMDGERTYGLVDCYNARKTQEYFDALRLKRPGRSNFEFVCATHPHIDHIAGIDYFLRTKKYQPREFWDSGFRHNISTYLTILETLRKNKNIRFVRVSSGMEWYYGNVQVTVLAPSVALRNRYATYGVDVNNASVVLRFENHPNDMMILKSTEYRDGVSIEEPGRAKRSVAILAGDAEFDSWSHIVDDFPRLERSETFEPLVTKMVNYLDCSVVKVSHHGSMHSAPLDVYEIMSPEKAIISAKQEMSTLKIGGRELERPLFPHPSAIISLEECGVEIATTDGSYESREDKDGKKYRPGWENPGSIVVVIPATGPARWKKLTDTSADSDVPEPPANV